MGASSKQQNPRQRLTLAEPNTIRRKCANRTSGPVADLPQISANGRHPKNGRLLMESFKERLLEIASDRPTANLTQIYKNGWRQTDTNNPRTTETRRFNTIRRKHANRTSGPVPDLPQILAKWMASEKWSIVNEIHIGNLMKIASDNPWQILCEYRKWVSQADSRIHGQD